MKKFRIKVDFRGRILLTQCKVQMKVLFFWVTIKTFSDPDPEYSHLMAEELLEHITE